MNSFFLTFDRAFCWEIFNDNQKISKVKCNIFLPFRTYEKEQLPLNSVKKITCAASPATTFRFSFIQVFTSAEMNVIVNLFFFVEMNIWSLKRGLLRSPNMTVMTNSRTARNDYDSHFNIAFY